MEGGGDVKVQTLCHPDLKSDKDADSEADEPFCLPRHINETGHDVAWRDDALY